jgi:hypothetical protein
MLGTGAGAVVLDTVGGLLVVTTVADMFLTIFNYDGYATLTTLFHRGWWRLLRGASSLVPAGAVRHTFLSIGSASMLPATVVLWLGLEITGFALLYESSLGGGAFALKAATPTLGTAFYLSAGAISSLSFGDVIARGAFDRALVDVETILGLATFTLALGYVVTAFGVLSALENLHGRVRRHTAHLQRPESLVSRHFRGGSRSDLPSFLQALADDLESYDQGLRRYPVVYFFHTRRTERSIPHVFTAIGDLIALLRWGLPPDEPIAGDAFLLALHDAYLQTLDRIRRNFVGPERIAEPEPAAEAELDGGRADVAAFRELQRLGRVAADADADGSAAAAYERYREWLPFAHRQHVVLGRTADRLGYERPEPVTRRPSTAARTGV